MNEIKLNGLIRNIEFSHQINNINYQKADMIVRSAQNIEDSINLVFKQCSQVPQENQLISLLGSVRSYTRQDINNKNKVNIYVSTYFDQPEDLFNNNEVTIDGRICKLDQLRTSKNGKLNFHAILANNIFIDDQNLKINNYLPLVFWGKLAQKASQLKINDKILINGQLHSRTYTKTLENNQKEIRIAHEIVVLKYEIQL